MIDEIAEHADTGAKVDDTPASSIEGEITGKIEGVKNAPDAPLMWFAPCFGGAVPAEGEMTPQTRTAYQLGNGVVQ